MSLDINSEIKYENADGKFKITMKLEDERTVLAHISGYENIESTEFVLSTLREYYRQIGKPILLYGSCTNFEGISAKSRSLWHKEVWKNRDIVEKFTVFNVNFFLRSLVNMFARVSKTPMKSFDTKEQAKAWLDRG